MITKDLSSHLALITGAPGGIGRASCNVLSDLGCAIAVHYNSAADEAKGLVAELNSSKSVRAQAYQADLSNYEEVRVFSDT